MGTQLRLNQKTAGLQGLLIAYRFAMLGHLLSGSAAAQSEPLGCHAAWHAPGQGYLRPVPSSAS